MKRGVSTMFINGLVVAVVLLFSFGVDVTNRLVHQRYEQTVASQRALIACNNASKVFQQQSDELTLRVNNYLETDSTDALLAYFAIIDNQSREHEIEIAEQIVHGQEYYSYKNTIYEKLNDFETSVMERTEERLMVETESISSLLHVQNVFEIVEELVIICLALLLYRQVTVVLRKYIRSISRDEAITPGGTSELRYLAAVINQYIALQSQRQKELRTIAELDALTQIPNRRALEDFMRRMFQRGDMHGALVLLDVDDFKRINDNYGHDLGDAALQNLVAQIHECIRADDFFARFGGDEFVIWMDGIQLGDVEAIKEKIQEVNHRTVLVANMTMRISISAGVTFCRHGDAYKDALRRVDTALYEMKRTGKHGCAVYEEL